MASLTNIPKFTIDYIADKPVNLNNLAKNEKGETKTNQIGKGNQEKTKRN